MTLLGVCMRIVFRFARLVFLTLVFEPIAYYLHPNHIMQNYDISLRKYMPDSLSKGLRQDQAAYLDHEKKVNKMARRIVKHACSFEKSALACFSSVCHYSFRYDWGQGLTAANKLREHIELLRDYPQSLPKGRGFSRRTSA